MRSRLVHTVLAEQRQPQTQMRLRVLGLERQHPLILRHRFVHVAAYCKNIRQVLMHVGLARLLSRRFTQFIESPRQLIHQHKQTAQVMVCFREVSVRFDSFLKLESGFRVTVLLNQQTAEIVPGFGEVWPAAQGFAKLVFP